MDKLKTVKIVVAILTFLLVFGMFSAIGIIFNKLSSPKNQVTNQTINQPQGSYIDNFKIDTEGNVFMLVKGGNQPDRIIITNPKKNPSPITINLVEQKNE